MNISELSDDELKAELIRRKLEAYKPPPEIDEKNWLPVINCCQEYVRALYEDNYVDEDIKHYVYEAAMEAVYGKDIWDWVNGKHPTKGNIKI